MRISVSDEQVRNVFLKVSGSPGFAESAALVARGGRPVEMLRAMAAYPPLLAAFGAMCEAVYPGGAVEREVKEVVILEVSRRNACQFCTQSHVSIAQHLGMSERPLDLLDTPESLTARQRAALAYTRAAMADANRVPETVWTDLRAAFTDAEIVEVTAMIGLISMLNLFNNCLGVRYHGEYDAR